MFNIHTPERQANETFQSYRSRRHLSQRIVKRLLSGTPSDMTQRDLDAGQRAVRRESIRQAGGIRQYKRLTYAAKHPWYTDPHPDMAAILRRA